MDARKLLNIFEKIRDNPGEYRIDGMKYLKASEIVKRWENSISSGTLANWRCQGKGPPFVKFGSKVLYPVKELEAWETAHTYAAANGNEENTEQIAS